MERKRINGSISERFWPRVNTSGGTDACWSWTLHVDRGGYGFIRQGKTMRSCHRVSWELTHGSIPEWLWVLHRCDNPPCVNPKHLFLGTRLDNVHDAIEKGRRGLGRGGQGKSGHRNVIWIKAVNKWRVKIWKPYGKGLGDFDTVEEAVARLSESDVKEIKGVYTWIGDR